eukprot:TRINITY_DN1582_c0_g1_i2.p1 TRINITY_DN1582_c0_g1~~TRINITY_DN1582_c0_g1_i2.p1  ORF type:complete len:615 (-),score=153.40 TRINITY_DN1582_c0_g1_i2:1026-2801(-)
MASRLNLKVVSQTLVEAMGKGDVTAEGDSFIDDKRRFRTLHQHLKAVSAACDKRLDDKLNYASQILGSEQVADVLNAFSRDMETNNDKGALYDTLKLYTDLQNRLLAQRKELKEAQAKLVEYMEAQLANEHKKIHDDQETYSRQRKYYDAVRSEVKDCENQTKPDPLKLYSAHQRLEQEKGNFESVQVRTYWELQDVNLRKDHELLNQFRILLLAQKQYFNNCNQMFEESATFITQLQDECDKASQVADKAKEDREARLAEAQCTRYEQKYDPFLAVLSSPKLELVSAMTTVFEQQDADQAMVLIVRILDCTNLALPIIRGEISRQVEETTDPTTMFRGNTCATKLMTAFTKIVGQSYIVETLRPSIQYVVDYPEDYEIDKLKVCEGETLDINRNAANLVETTANFIDHIISSTGDFPMQLRVIAKHLRDEVTSKFGERAGLVAVGGFLFLRFFCPNVLSPTVMGILSTPPNKNTMRALVLITKAMQNIANDVEVNKESYMAVLNDFYTNYKEKLFGWFASLTNVSTNLSEGYKPVASRQEIEASELPQLKKLCLDNLKLLGKTIITNNDKPTLVQLSCSLAHLERHLTLF